MDNTPSQVTCSDHVLMNAIAGIVFILAGDGFIVVCVMANRPGFGMILTLLCGLAAIIIGFYYMCCFINRRVTVSEDGVIYRSFTGKTTKYTWDEVTVSHHAGANSYTTFNIKGKNKVFYGYTKNFQRLYDWLYENKHFDNDTMRQEEKAHEKHDDVIRAMQQKALDKGNEE